MQPRMPTNDAEAICKAVVRPTMRFVPVKSKDTQGVAVEHVRLVPKLILFGRNDVARIFLVNSKALPCPASEERNFTGIKTRRVIGSPSSSISAPTPFSVPETDR